ncbi:hypothetical protein [Wenyingzhuangia sp. 2_MG-2023]|uniref:hypothetical protein n=1 Tax=Wenyingzhuangia sp. 2_MG-2023 TaxID=3062639 RepID=UPI0026E3788A|nr:hypothetical protein [Wenyingzhuangia sp. 2_MG-2023]MDO6737139.1 hypothetical protein [Wenyingzhuangia sp. 2_MG-2023]
MFASYMYKYTSAMFPMLKLREDLTKNKQLLIGKNLFINGVEYFTLKDFGNKILEFNKDLYHTEIRLSHYQERDSWESESISGQPKGFKALYVYIYKKRKASKTKTSDSGAAAFYKEHGTKGEF